MTDTNKPRESGDDQDNVRLIGATKMAELIGNRLRQQKRLTATPSELAYAFVATLNGIDSSARLGEIALDADLKTWCAANGIKDSHLRAAFAKARHERKLALEKQTGIRKPSRRRKSTNPGDSGTTAPA